MIQRRALDDLHLDATNTASLAADQVSRLGASSNTRRAIDIFGHIGQQTEPAQLVSADPSLLGTFRSQIRQQSLPGLMLDTLCSFAASITSTFLLATWSVLKVLFKRLSVHLVLLGLLAASAAANLWAGSGEAVDWWRDRRTAGFMARVGVRPNLAMSRAVYLRDLPEIFSATNDTAAATTAFLPHAPDPNSKCAQTFHNVLARSDLDAFSLEGHGETGPGAFSEASTRSTASRLQRTRHRLGVYRNDLLVALRMVNRIETESVRAEWENWVVEEGVKCLRTASLLRQDAEERRNRNASVDVGGMDGALASRLGADDAMKLAQWHDEYCTSCRREKEVLFGADAGVM